MVAMVILTSCLSALPFFDAPPPRPGDRLASARERCSGGRPRIKARAWRSSAGKGFLQLGDVDLLHLQHRLHDPVGLLAVGIARHLGHEGGDDLPGEAILVLEPAALLSVRVAALAELLPV